MAAGVPAAGSGVADGLCGQGDRRPARHLLLRQRPGSQNPRRVSARPSGACSWMDLACTSDGPRVYLTGGTGVTAAPAHCPGRISSEPSACAIRPDVTLCMTIRDQLEAAGCWLDDLTRDGQILTPELHAECPGRGATFRSWNRLEPRHYCTSPAENGHQSRWTTPARPAPSTTTPRSSIVTW